MNIRRVFGVIVFAIGIVLLVMGLNGRQETGQKISKQLTGHYSDTIVSYIIGGVVLIVGGIAIFFVRGPKR